MGKVRKTIRVVITRIIKIKILLQISKKKKSTIQQFGKKAHRMQIRQSSEGTRCKANNVQRMNAGERLKICRMVVGHIISFIA